MIPYGRQSIDQDDIQAVTETLQSAYLTTGPKVKEFEQALASYVGAQHAVVVSSGTAALHAAYAVLGLGPGDEILVPTMSFLATANAALYVGAKPVFVDSLPNGFVLDLKDARRKITPRTKAIAPVHFAGEPVDLDAVHALAKEFHLKVIEDAAHALGAEYHHKRIGSLSDMTIFSFHPVKHVTTAEGGAITTQDAVLARRLQQFRHHGIDVGVNERDAKQQWRYDMSDLGYNYRLSDIQCALGLSQLKKADRFLARRSEITNTYQKAFSSLSYLRLPNVMTDGNRHAWHLYPIQLDTKALGLSRDDVFVRLRSRGIGVQVHYRPIHLNSYYSRLGSKKGDCPQAETLFENILSLPLFPAMTDEMVQRVISEVKQLAPMASTPGKTA